jgi:hypothetical protein
MSRLFDQNDFAVGVTLLQLPKGRSDLRQRVCGRDWYFQVT